MNRPSLERSLHGEKESSSLVSVRLFRGVLVFWKIFLVQIISEAGYAGAQEGRGFPCVFGPFIYRERPAGLLYAER